MRNILYVILSFIVLLCLPFKSESQIKENLPNGNIYYVQAKPVVIFADFDGDKKNEKMIIQQSIEGEYPNGKLNISIEIFKQNKNVFEYKTNYKYDNVYNTINYVKIVRFEGETEKGYHDIAFIVTGEGLLHLNILCWESTMREGDIAKHALGKAEYKGRYRFVKTDIQISAPYD